MGIDYEKKIETLRENLLNLAWDCHSGWVEKDGVSNWSNERVEKVAQNVIDSLTIKEDKSNA